MNIIMHSSSIRIDRIRSIILIAIVAATAGCTDLSTHLDDPGSLTIDQIIRVETSKTEMLANGLERSRITAYLLGDTPDNLEIIFRASGGRFSGLPGSGSLDGNQQEFRVNAVNREASVDLIAGTESKVVTVTAWVDKFGDRVDINLLPSLPQEIELSADRTVVDADGNATVSLTAALLRIDRRERVSDGTRILFEAFDDTTRATIRQLRRSATSSNGSATVSVVGNEARGVKFIARVDSPLSDARDSLLVRFK